MQLRDKNGLPTGVASKKAMLDARMCKVEHPDGHKASLAANTIAENVFAQVDEEGNRRVLFKETMNHGTDDFKVKHETERNKEGT